METTTIVERDIAKNSGEATDVDLPDQRIFQPPPEKHEAGPAKCDRRIGGCDARGCNVRSFQKLGDSNQWPS